MEHVVSTFACSSWQMPRGPLGLGLDDVRTWGVRPLHLPAGMQVEKSSRYARNVTIEALLAGGCM